MCSRFYMSADAKEIEETYAYVQQSPLTPVFLKKGDPILGSGEIRPTNVVPVIAPNRKGQTAAFPMKWGFRLPKGSLAFNARVETAAEKPTFRESFMRRRCVIPASWYYEWEHLVNVNGQKATGDKFMFQPRGETMTWLAGIYRFEEGLPYFTVLTREAANEIRSIHDRMPLILPAEKIRDWISPEGNPQELLPFALTDLVMERAEKIS